MAKVHYALVLEVNATEKENTEIRQEKINLKWCGLLGRQEKISK